jgi:2Fe-2S ferredoxin
MAKVTYITPSGEEVVVEDAIGNLMEIAREHGVEGIEGACSGCCSCATCHIQVPTEWLDKTGRATESEMDLIDLESETDERSRLSCQVEMTDALDGLVVQVAPF